MNTETEKMRSRENLDEGLSTEDERLLRSGNIVLCLLLAIALLSISGCAKSLTVSKAAIVKIEKPVVVLPDRPVMLPVKFIE